MSKRHSQCGLVGLLVAAIALAPTLGRAQAAAAAVCKDGTTSPASGRGACSGHGGVDRKATKAAQSPAKTTAAAARVACTDGTTSKPGRGACSHHGGVSGSTPNASTAAQAPTRSAPKTPAAAPSATPPTEVPQPAPARSRSEAKSPAPSAVGSGAREDNNPIDAIAQCKDGLYSHAKHRRGACSRHGGVAKWMPA